MINTVILIGKVHESRIHFTDEGLCVLRFILRTWEGKSEFHKIVYFDPTGEKAYKYNEKFNDSGFNGYVYVRGRLQYRSYTGSDGVKRRIVEVVARNIVLIDPIPKNGYENEKAENSTVNTSEHREKVINEGSLKKAQTEKVHDTYTLDVDEEEIPF